MMAKTVSYQTNRDIGDQLDDIVVQKYNRFASLIGSKRKLKKSINSGATFGDLDVHSDTCLISDKTQSVSKHFVVKSKELQEVMTKARHAQRLPVLIGKSQECLIAVIPLDDFLGMLADYENLLDQTQHLMKEVKT